MYKVGQKIKTEYTNPPVLECDQYTIGLRVGIYEEGKPLAYFVVEYTDDTTIKGTIVEVCN